MAVNIREINKNGSAKKEFKGVKWLVIGAAALLVAVNSFTIVPAGNTGVVLTLGEVSDKGLDAGFHLKIPFIQNVQDMSNKIQVYETPASAVSKDLQTVSSNIAVNYKLVSDNSPKMYEEVGAEYQTILIAPVVQECMKSVTAKYTAEELITERAAVGEEVKASLDSKLNAYGIYIEKFNIVNFDFSAEFNRIFSKQKQNSSRQSKLQTLKPRRKLSQQTLRLRLLSLRQRLRQRQTSSLKNRCQKRLSLTSRFRSGTALCLRLQAATRADFFST